MFVNLIINLFSFLLGSMVFFLTVISPSVFKVLDEKYSSLFLRLVFPRLFIFGFIISIIVLFFSLIDNQLLSIYVSLFISIGFLYNTIFLIPRINKMRDLSNQGDESAKNKFKLYHLTSVIIFVLQLILCIIMISYYNLFL